MNERNEIAVIDRFNYRVQIFSSDGTYLSLWAAARLNKTD